MKKRGDSQFGLFLITVIIVILYTGCSLQKEKKQCYKVK